ncbi:MAG: hypothetical protein HUK15_08415, partial [Bacteroidales bacterium]|nr:hypothetical protein [Bacteroidales bacterium]
MIKSVSVLGSGNVAFHLAKKLFAENVRIDCIFSRNKITGTELSDAVKALFTDDCNKIPSSSDAYIFALSDEGNMNLAEKVSLPTDKIFIHTSGSLPKEIFPFKNAAVVYPFQTFTRNVEIKDYDKIPLCVDADENCLI